MHKLLHYQSKFRVWKLLISDTTKI